MSRSAAFLLALLSPLALVADGGPRVIAYELDVTFSPETSSVEGAATLRLAAPRPDETARLYVHGELEITSVRTGDAELELAERSVLFDRDYSLIAREVSFQLPAGRAEELHVRWRGPMHRSRARSPSDYMRIDGDGVFLRSLGYSVWFPVLLDSPAAEPPPADLRATIRTPAALESVVVGRRIAARTEGSQRVSVWEADQIPLFAAQVTARPYVVTTRGDVTAYSLADPEARSATEEILDLVSNLSERYLDLYDDRQGGQPLHIAQMPEYGDISSGNVVGLSDQTWTEISNTAWARRTIAHELVHPFVDPAVDPTDPIWALVVEGFPSYFHLPVLDGLGWDEGLDAYFDRLETGYLEKRRTGRHRRGWELPPETPLSEIGPDQLGEYKDLFVLSDRAVLFLDWLRRTTGQSEFDELVRQIVRRDELDADTFRRLVVESTPVTEADLDLWLRTTEFPVRFRRKPG